MKGFDPRYSQAVDKYMTPTSEFFENADGTGTAVISERPVRFKAPDGTWRTIDTSLAADADGSLRPRSMEKTPRIAVRGGSPALVFPTSAGDIEMRHSDLAVDGTHPLGSASGGVPAGSAAALADVHGAHARLGVGNGVQVTYRVLPTGVQDDFVLSSASGGSSFVVTMTLPTGVSARQRGTSVQFVDATGAVVAVYSGGVAYDAVAAAQGDSAPASTVTPVTVTLVSGGRAAAVVRVAIDSAWLSSLSRAFPVVIDPTATWSVGFDSGYDDTYVSSDCQTCTAPTAGPNAGTPYENLTFLRLGAATSAGTARALLPFDGLQTYQPPADYEFTSSSTAQLSLYAYTGPSTACTDTAGVDVIISSWDPSTVTWNSQPAVTSSPPDGWQTVSPNMNYSDTFDVSTAIAGLYNGLAWHGLELRQYDDPTAPDCWRGFDSSNGDINPSLAVTYDYVAPPPPGTTTNDNGTVLSQSTMDDPVDVVTGNLKEPASDLASPAGVFELGWTRTYNAYDAENDVSPGGLGLGWSSTFYPTIQATSDGTGNVQMKSPDGREVRWTPNGSGGFVRPFEYPADLAVVSGNYRVSFDGGSYWDFDSLGRLAAMTSPNGQSVAINRNTSGQLITAVSSTGAQLSFTYGTSGYGSGKISSVSGPAGTVTYGYDSAGDLVSVTDAGGHTTKYSYDSYHRLVSITDPSGVVEITNNFDGQGRVASQKHASGGTTNFSYGTYDSTDSLWESVVTDTVTGASGQVTFYYNSSKEVQRVEDNLPNTSGGVGNTMAEDFADSLGDLTSVTSRLGGQDNLTYDSSNHMTCDAQPGATCPAAGAALDSGTGAYSASSYDSLGRVTAKFVNGSGTTSYTYTGSDRLPTTVSDASGDVTSYVISNGLVTSQTDPDGVTTSFTYDAAGRMTSQTVGGNATTYTYDSAGRQTCVAQPGGSCPGVSGGSGSYTTTTYYPSGLVESKRAPDGGVTSYTYDSAGRQLTVTDPTGVVTNNHYDPTTGLLMAVDKPGQYVNGVLQYMTTHYTYDANGNQTCIAAPGGTCPTSSGTGGVEPYTLTTYGALGRVISTSNELGQKTSYKYDADGNKIETDNPDGTVIKAAYDAAGRLYCTTAPGASASAVNCPDLNGNGGVGRYTLTYYDSFGRISCVAQPGGSCLNGGSGPITTYTYDGLGRQATVTDVNGGTTTTTYTKGGRKYQVTDPDGGVTTHTYDGAGRVVSVTNPDDGVTTTSYTPQGWVASTTDPEGLVTSHTYDAAGRQATTTGPDGVVTTRTYTLRGEVKTQQVGGDGTVTYTYNGDGTVASVTDALGNTTSYRYDARGNRTVRTDAAGKTQTRAYDNANELVQQADQLNRATATTYYDDPTNGHKTVSSDPSGRSTTTVYNPDETTESLTYADSAGSLAYAYAYDTLGHVTSIAAPDGTWRYASNARGQLTSETAPGGAKTSWAYDAAGRRTTMTYPDGTAVAYTYDKAARLTKETITPAGGSAQVTSYTYNADGQLLTVSLPDGSRSYAYGTSGPGAGKVVSYTQTLPGATFATTLSYDANGRLASQTVQPPTPLRAIASGWKHSVAIGPNGTVWCWGMGGSGELGNGSTSDSTLPVRASGILDAVQVAGGYQFSAAVTADGSVWVWGTNLHGEFGNGGTASSTTPVKVPGLSGVVSISAESEGMLAVKSDGSVWAWGNNGSGQLGTGTTTNSLVPVQVPGLSGAIAVSGAGYTSAALTSDGQVWMWGRNSYGQVGNDTTTNALSPVHVAGLPNVTAISAGYNHTLALASDGTVWTWGYGGDGEMGNGTTTNSLVPLQIPGLSGISAVAAGMGHSLALTNTGAVWAWGYGGYGELGDGQTSNSSIPVQVSGLSGVSAIAAGQLHSMALTSTGTLWSWGGNANGQLGNGTTNTATLVVQVAGIGQQGGAISAVAAGWLHSLAVGAGGKVWAWGRGDYGQLGNGSTTSSSSPVQVGGLSGVRQVSGGYLFSTALKSDGTVWAWGYNLQGQLGNGTTTSSSTPVQVAGLTGVVAIASGAYDTLALKSDGTVWAWGRNNDGQLGDGTTTDRHAPVQVPGLSGVVAISGSGYSSAALTSDGSVWMWGLNNYGQLGTGTTTNTNTPAKLTTLSGVSTISAGENHTLALTSSGQVWAWGYNGDGELGDGTTTNSEIPVQLASLSGVTSVVAGLGHSLALAVSGTVDAWGYGGYGEIGDGGTSNALTPTQVPGLSNVRALSAGQLHSLALTSTGVLMAWGGNTYGQIGDGTTSNALTVVQPVSVNPPPAVVTSYGYDAAGQLTSQTPSNGPATTYSYDNLGHRATVSSSGVVTSYAYDDAGELCWTATGSTASTNTCASPPTGAVIYTYDPAGRMLSQTAAGDESTSYRYDPAGRLETLHRIAGTTDTTQTRGYNPDGDLITADNTGSSTTSTSLSWDDAAGLPTLAAQTSGGNTTDLTSGAGQWVTALVGGTAHGISIDVFGNVTPTSPTQNLATANSYDAWGTPDANSISLEPTLGYRGELQFGDTVDLRARNYVTTLGAFTSVDPLDGVNGATTVAALYPYANNNPAANVDPSGKSATDWNAFASAWHAARAAAPASGGTGAGAEESAMEDDGFSYVWEIASSGFSNSPSIHIGVYDLPVDALMIGVVNLSYWGYDFKIDFPRNAVYFHVVGDDEADLGFDSSHAFFLMAGTCEAPGPDGLWDWTGMTCGFTATLNVDLDAASHEILNYYEYLREREDYEDAAVVSEHPAADPQEALPFYYVEILKPVLKSCPPPLIPGRC